MALQNVEQCVKHQLSWRSVYFSGKAGQEREGFLPKPLTSELFPSLRENVSTLEMGLATLLTD